MLTVARSVLERLDLEVVLERVLDAALELTGAQYAALGVLDEGRTKLGRFLTRGVDDSTRRLIGPLPTGRGVLGELIRDPEPLRLADVGTHPYSYGFPVGHPPMRSFLGVPILAGGSPFLGNLYLTEKRGGGPFTVEDEQAAVLLADFAGLAIDHARRFGASEGQRIELEHIVSALDATIQITRAIGGQTDLSAILELVAKRGRALVSARALVIELVVGEQLELAAGAGELPATLVGERVALENTVASAALRSGSSQRLTDRLNRARFDQHGLGQLGVDAEDGLVVPLVFRDRSYGVLVAIDHLGDGDFTAEHLRLLESFATSAATAVATAQSAADERRRQRRRPRRPNEDAGHGSCTTRRCSRWGSLRLILSAAGRSDTIEAKAKAIGQALEQLDDITTLRGLITELRPAALDQLGLEPALLALIDRHRANGLEVEALVDLSFEHDRTAERLDPELETGLYRIVQEALTNATKHGGAERAVVELVEDGGSIRIKVADNGSGFDLTAPTAGFGSGAGMRERVELLKGELAIESALGNGTMARSNPSADRRRCHRS